MCRPNKEYITKVVTLGITAVQIIMVGAATGIGDSGIIGIIAETDALEIETQCIVGIKLANAITPIPALAGVGVMLL